MGYVVSFPVSLRILQSTFCVPERMSPTFLVPTPGKPNILYDVELKSPEKLIVPDTTPDGRVVSVHAGEKRPDPASFSVLTRQ